MTDELKTLVEAKIEAKKKKELERVEKQIAADRDVIDKAIELIKTHTLYKRIHEGNNCVYKLATEEMFKNDYIKEPRSSWRKGINFYADSFNERVNKGVIEVNGETYYDIRYALNEYKRYVEKLTSSLTYLERELNEKKKELETLNNGFPTLKKAIEEWQEYESGVKNE